MKKTIITLIAAVLFIHAAYAQKARLGFTGGATFSNYQQKTDGQDDNGKSKTGMTAGVIAHFPASKNFMVQTGAHWVQKGTMEQEGSDKVSLVVNSIEVPVNFLYSSNGFFIGAGPSISFAVSGKWKFKFGGEETSIKAKFGNSDDDHMKGLDFGANAVAGYQFPGGFLMMANFNQGLSNLVPGDADNSKLKSHYFGIRLGYVLKDGK